VPRAEDSIGDLSLRSTLVLRNLWIPQDRGLYMRQSRPGSSLWLPSCERRIGCSRGGASNQSGSPLNSSTGEPERRGSSLHLLVGLLHKMEAGGRQRGNDDDDDEVKRAELLEAFRSLDPEGDRGGWKTASGRSSTRHSRHSIRQSSRQSRGAAAGLAPRGWVPAPPDSRGRDKCGKLEYHSQDSSDESELDSSGADQQQQQQPRGNRGREGAVPTHRNAHAHIHARPQQPREHPAPRKDNNHSPGKRRVKFVEAQASAGEDGEQEELSKKRSKEEQSLPDLPFGRLHITRKGETWDLRNKLRHEDWRTIFLQLAIAIMNNPKLKVIDVRDNGLDCRAGAIIAAALKSNGNVERASDIPIGDLTAGKVEQLDLQHMGLSEAAILSVFLNGPANGVLKHLDFSHCVTEMGSQGGTALAKGLQGLNAISSLDLSHAGLSSDGMEVVSGGLESCRTLTKLHLGTNGLDYRSGAYLCRILSKNPMLTDLNLGNNNLGEKGVVDLLPVSMPHCTHRDAFTHSMRCARTHARTCI
jgi:hypothetical protein